jgi:hypothetical protein
MTLYARINPDTTLPETRDFASAPNAAKGWVPLIIDVQPTPSAMQVVVNAGIVVGATEAHQTWGLRTKTQAEIDQSDDAADAAALKASAVVAALKAEVAGTSTLTAAQFRSLAARVLLFLVRRAIGGG